MIRYQGRLCVPSVDNLREQILEDAHGQVTQQYIVTLKEVYRWNGLKRDIEEFVFKHVKFQQVKSEHLNPSGLI